MTAIKINPARLPYRGEPTRDRKPVLIVPEGAAIVKVANKSVSEIPCDWVRRHRRHKENMWTEEQEQTAFRMWDEGKSLQEISEATGRSVLAVDKRLWTICKKRGLRRIDKRVNIYTPEETAEIVRLHNAGRDAREISRITGRSFDSIKNKICRLKKSGYIIKDHRKD